MIHHKQELELGTDGRRMLDLLRNQLTVLENIADLTHEQASLIAEDRITALLELLTEKQRVLSSLAMVQADLEPYLKVPPELRHWPDARTRESARQAAELCNKLLATITAQEAADQDSLQVSRARLQQQMETFHQASAAHRAYESIDIPPASSLDLGLS